MTIFTKLKLGLFRNIPPSKRWLIPDMQRRLGLMSAERRRESGVTRDGRRGKYVPADEDAKHAYVAAFRYARRGEMPLA